MTCLFRALKVLFKYLESYPNFQTSGKSPLRTKLSHTECLRRIFQTPFELHDVSTKRYISIQ